MILGLNAFFGEHAPPSDLAALVELGVQSVRHGDEKRVTSGLETLALAQELSDVGIQPFMVVFNVDMVTMLHPGMHVELFNELDGDVTPAQYVARCLPIIEVAEQRGLQVWVGAISNLNQRGLSWLGAVLPGLPTSVNVSYHWYAHRTNRLIPHPGFRSRDDEMNALHKIVDTGVRGHRRLACTEVGFDTEEHAYPAPSLFNWRRNKIYRWSEDQVLQMMRDEILFADMHGVERLYVYQLNDSPPGGLDGSIGIRRLTSEFKPGEFKPVARVFERVRIPHPSLPVSVPIQEV